MKAVRPDWDICRNRDRKDIERTENLYYNERSGEKYDKIKEKTIV